MNVLTDLYPGTTFASIILYYTQAPLVPEVAIQEKYPYYLRCISINKN